MVQEAKRMNYHNGLFLEEDDFIMEQNYNIQMRRLMNWYLNRAHGVLEGLKVERDVSSGANKYRITPGIAISNSGEDKWYGTEIILSSDRVVNVPPNGQGGGDYYITISYSEAKAVKNQEKGPEEIYWIEEPKIDVESVGSVSPDSLEKKIILTRIKVSDGNHEQNDDDRMELGRALRSINKKISIGNSTSPEQLEVKGTVEATEFIGDGSKLENAGKWTDVEGGISYNEGNVGIGTGDTIFSEQTHKLHIVPQGPGGILIGKKGGSTNLEIIISAANNGFSKFQCIKNSSEKGDICLNPDGGDVGIGTTSPEQKLDVAGIVKAASFIPPSDARFKTDIMPLTDVLDKLEKIRGVSFKWNKLDPYGRSESGREIGLIAQEVEEAFPELVIKWGDEGYRGIDYNRFTGVLLEAIKELKAENEVFKEKIKALEDAGSRNEMLNH